LINLIFTFNLSKNKIDYTYSVKKTDSCKLEHSAKELMTMISTYFSKIETLSKEIRQNLPQTLSWKHDDRYPVVMSEFEAKYTQAVFSQLKPFFKHTWDINSFKQAPEATHKFYEQFGEFMPSQVFLSTEDIDSTFIYCVAWPWSDGDMLSVRLAPYNPNLSKKDNHELFKKFEALFFKPKK